MSNEIKVADHGGNSTISNHGKHITLRRNGWATLQEVRMSPRESVTLRCQYRAIPADRPGVVTAFRIGTRVNGENSSGGTNCFTKPDNGWYTAYMTAKRGNRVTFLLTTGHDISRPDYDVDIEITDIDIIRNYNGARSRKISFESDTHVVTTDGLWEINGQPFAPIGMYVDNKRADWSLYAKQGFSVNMWAPSRKRVIQSADNGLYAMYSIGPYLWDKGWGYNDGAPSRITRMLKQLDPILNDPVASKNLIGYYFDNEGYRQYADIVEGIEALRRVDSTRPIYFLHGQHGMAQAFAPWCDMTGAYTGFTNTGGAGGGVGSASLRILNALPEQHAPVVFAQVNGRTTTSMTTALVSIRAGLANGVAYWADREKPTPTRPATPVEKAGWWAGFPAVADEINEIIKARHEGRNIDDDDDDEVDEGGGVDEPDDDKDETETHKSARLIHFELEGKQYEIIFRESNEV